MKKREEHDDSEAVRRLLRVLGALGPHADEFVLRYKEASDVDLREAMGRSRSLRYGDIDPLGLRYTKGLAGILCFAAVALALFGATIALACLGIGLGLRFRANRQIREFYLDRSHLTHASIHFELLEPCLRDKDGTARDIVAEHVDSMAVMLECGVLFESSFMRLVDTASYLEFVSPHVEMHREKARRKIRDDQRRFGDPQAAERP